MIQDKIIFGCANICSNNSMNKALKILSFAKDLGIRNFDTASSYGNGYSELLLGLAFEGNKEINITTKIGFQPSYKTLLPIHIKLKLNKILFPTRKIKAISHKCKKVVGKLIGNSSSGQDYKNSKHLSGLLSTSITRLRGHFIDSLLFHEINPHNVNGKTINEIERLIGSKTKLGYGGTSQENILEKSPPTWLKVLQIGFPQNDVERKKLFNFIEKYPDIEIRLFHLFKHNKRSSFAIKKRMDESKKILFKFPNVKLIFQTDSLEKMSYNYNYLVNL